MISTLRSRSDLSRAADRRSWSTVFALIEKKYGQKVVSVQQEISAVLIDRAVAKHLKTTPGSPGLSILRVYRGQGGAVLQASQAISPADRFTYGIELKLELGR